MLLPFEKLYEEHVINWNFVFSFLFNEQVLSEQGMMHGNFYIFSNHSIQMNTLE